MKRKILCLTVGLAFASFSVRAQDYQPLLVSSGFNEKVIAYSNLPAAASTTNSVDNEDRAFMNTSFTTVWGMPGPSYALPVDGFIASAATEGLSFQMAAANTVNVLRIPDQNGNGTLEFNEGAQAGNVYLLATSGSGSAEIAVTVHFTDGSSQAFTGVVVPNWFNGTEQPVARQGFGLVKREANQIDNPADNPRLFQIALDILTENEAKTIDNIVITKTSAGEGVVNVFAVTAEIANNCPTPAPIAENQTNCAGTTLSDLTVEGVEDAVFTWYDADGNILDANLPISDTIYYVSQTADGCESSRTAISVAVNPGPHMPVGEELQQFTDGDTVASLEVTFEEGTTPAFYIMNDAGELTATPASTPLTDGETYYIAQLHDGCRSEALRITVTEILGTAGHTAIKVLAYPNPANDSITVSGDDTIKEIAIVNLLGQKLLKEEGNGQNTVVNLAGLAPGSYILALTTADGKTGTLKLVKK